MIHDIIWYDLHGPGDVVLVQTTVPIGKQSLDGVKDRLGSLGLTVIDVWNTDSICVSLRVAGRVGGAKFTDEQCSFLCGNERVEDMKQ